MQFISDSFIFNNKGKKETNDQNQQQQQQQQQDIVTIDQDVTKRYSMI